MFNKLRRMWNKFTKITRDKNLFSAIAYSFKWVFYKKIMLPYEFVEDINIDKKQFTPQKTNSKNLTINWVIPDFFIGSGGHTTIFRTIKFLEEFGHNCNIYIFGGSQFGSAERAKKIIVDHFFPIKANVYDDCENIKDSDALIATSWDTAYLVFQKNNTKQKYYFVQDFEPMFFQMGSPYLFAENTYRLGLQCITAGKWLAKKMKEYGNEADYFNLAYDHDIYKPNNKVKRKKQIVYYTRTITPRRGFELAMLALDKVKQQHPELEIIFIGQKKLPPMPFKYTNLGVLNREELAALYQESMLGVSISLTNYSLLPQEMMACGLPVVEMRGENTETVFGENPDYIALSPAMPIGLAETIITLIEDEKKRNKQSSQALKYVADLSWEASARKVEKAIMGGLE